MFFFVPGCLKKKNTKSKKIAEAHWHFAEAKSSCLGKSLPRHIFPNSEGCVTAFSIYLLKR